MSEIGRLGAVRILPLLALLTAAGEPPARRYPVLQARPPDWPTLSSRLPISAPDWTDRSVYPRDAWQLEQEGTVTMAMVIGADGMPLSCSIMGSSGFAELDDGTCDLGMTMRFSPPRDAEGRPAQALYRGRIIWGLEDTRPMQPARLAVSLELADGRIVQCRTDGSGAVPKPWPRIACRIVAYELRQLLGAGLPNARRATVTLTLRPTGDTSSWPAPPGDATAFRRTEFTLDANDDIRDCRVTEDRGFGPHRDDYGGVCGLFLPQTPLEPGDGGVRSGALEIGVSVER